MCWYEESYFHCEPAQVPSGTVTRIGIGKTLALYVTPAARSTVCPLGARKSVLNSSRGAPAAAVAASRQLASAAANAAVIVLLCTTAPPNSHYNSVPPKHPPRLEHEERERWRREGRKGQTFRVERRTNPAL